MQKQRPPDLSASRRYFSTAAQVYSSLDARSTVRASTEATCLQDLPADAPTRGRGAYITRGTSSVYTYRAVAGGRVGTMRRRARQRGTNAKRVRCDDAPTRQHGTRRIKFARALASQRPPSRERPPLGGGGAGRALFPSLCPSPRSRSIDETEHRRRQVRGPPACSSAGTSLSAARRRRPRQRTYKESHLPAFPRLVDDPRAVGPKGPWRRPGAAGRPSRTLCGGAAFLGRCGRAAAMQPRARAGRDFQ